MRLIKSGVLGGALALMSVSAAFADGIAWPNLERFLGVSRIFNNDFIGDGKDRWRTGSYDVSMTFGDDITGGLPEAAFELMQYRLRAEILAPEDLSRTTAAPDRPYAGVIGLGAFTHFERGDLNLSFGGELVLTGSQTGLGAFQTWAHEKLGVQVPNMLAEQLPNRVYGSIQGEVSRDLKFGNALVRPFAEGQVGFETYARVGVDTIWGRNVSQNFFVRDPVTGHLVTNVRHSDDRSFGFMVGSDVAYVAHSHLLPDSRGVEVQNVRTRARAGFVYEGENAGLFYGVTWLSREFEAQRDSQVTGSLNVKINF